MGRFRQRLSEEDLKRINELIKERGMGMLLEAVLSLDDDDNSGNPLADAGIPFLID